MSGTVAAFDEATGQHTVRLDSDGTFQTHYLAYYFKQCSPPLGSVTYPNGVQVCSCGKPSPEEAARAAMEAAVAAETLFSAAQSKRRVRTGRKYSGGMLAEHDPTEEAEVVSKKARKAPGTRDVAAKPVQTLSKAATATTAKGRHRSGREARSPMASRLQY